MTHKVYIPDNVFDKIAAAYERVNGPPKTDGELLDECAAEIDAGAEPTRCEICKQQCDTIAGLVVHVAKYHGRA